MAAVKETQQKSNTWQEYSLNRYFGKYPVFYPVNMTFFTYEHYYSSVGRFTTVPIYSLNRFYFVKVEDSPKKYAQTYETSCHH